MLETNFQNQLKLKARIERKARLRMKQAKKKIKIPLTSLVEGYGL